MADLFEFTEMDPEDGRTEKPAVAYGPPIPAPPGYHEVPFDLERYQAPAPPALASVLPEGFNLAALLTFLPDIRLKQELAAAAKSALAIDVAGQAGLDAADTARAQLKASMGRILTCFDGTRDAPGPTALAHDLHSRLTGLRADFVREGKEAVETLDSRIVAENRRLAHVAAEQRRLDQAAADEQTRAELARVAAEAERSKAPAPVVEALKAQAQVATAPPVAARGPAPLARSTVVEAWKCRLAGSPAEADPNPKMADLTEPQRARALEVMRAVLDGKAPLVFFEFNWGKINGRAESDKTTLAIPGLEAFDAGGVRGKGRR